jgi:hypothetical protein
MALYGAGVVAIEVEVAVIDQVEHGVLVRDDPIPDDDLVGVGQGVRHVDLGRAGHPLVTVRAHEAEGHRRLLSPRRARLPEASEVWVAPAV